MNDGDPSTTMPEPKTTEINCTSSEAIFDELEGVIGDIHDYLQSFCGRLQRLALEPPAPILDADESGHMVEGREDWEAKRTQVEQRIREQVDLLADAWLRLEAEQRSLLQMKEGLAVDPTPRTQTSMADIGVESVCHGVPGGVQVPPIPQQDAVYEFERLRQEIQTIRQNNNVKRG